MLDPLHVTSLHTYPVKSMLGEAVGFLDVDERGCVGDRSWSVRTAAGKIGSGKNNKRFETVPGLLELVAARLDGRVVVRFPDGTVCGVDDPDAAARVSHHVGRPVTLARETTVSHFDDGPVSLVGRASVDALSDYRGEPVEPARFRPNIVLEGAAGFAEDRWVGRRVHVGTSVLQVSMPSPRCVMIDAKTAELPAQPGNLTAIGRLNDACLGVIATVVRPGRIRVGDAAVLE